MKSALSAAGTAAMYSKTVTESLQIAFQMGSFETSSNGVCGKESLFLLGFTQGIVNFFVIIATDAHTRFHQFESNPENNTAEPTSLVITGPENAVPKTEARARFLG